jgi:fumarylacetoacetase
MPDPSLDLTHDSQLSSWVAESKEHRDFPIQNLPFGVFTRPAHPGQPRGGIAIGDSILDLRTLHAANLLPPEAQTACLTASGPTLNPFLALGPGPRVALRRAVSYLLSDASPPRPELLHLASNCTLHLPCAIGNYTDFYAGIQHARNVGAIFRPNDPLTPNYKWVPIGYHGRASSVCASDVDVRRPNGQRKQINDLAPIFGPSRSLDFESELGMWVGPSNHLGMPVPIDQAKNHIAGYCLLNDWSARDIQSWEYQPLGPFLGKSFHTTVSPWIITPEALAPFRQPQAQRPTGDPQPLPYLLDLVDQAAGALNIDLEAFLLTPTMRAQNLGPQRISCSNVLDLYWTPQQLLTHHTSNGCNLIPGDLLGSGTISAPVTAGAGSLLEITQGGEQPFIVSSGEERTYLEDGDEIILRASAHRKGFVSIGFGECRAMILPAFE